eukprot:3934251-Rhodomonas_salina.1
MYVALPPTLPPTLPPKQARQKELPIFADLTCHTATLPHDHAASHACNSDISLWVEANISHQLGASGEVVGHQSRLVSVPYKCRPPIDSDPCASIHTDIDHVGCHLHDPVESRRPVEYVVVPTALESHTEVYVCPEYSTSTYVPTMR